MILINFLIRNGPYCILIHLLHFIITELDVIVNNAIKECKLLPFHEQSLICFLQHSDKVPRNQIFFDIEDLKHITSFERNPGGQIYLTQELESAVHGTVPTKFFRNQLLSKALPTDVPVIYTHVPNHENYISDDRHFCVINHGVNNNNEPDMIEHFQELVIKMFEEGDLANSFSFKEKKRASTPSMVSDNKDKSCQTNQSCDVSVITMDSLSSTSSHGCKKKKSFTETEI